MLDIYRHQSNKWARSLNKLFRVQSVPILRSFALGTDKRYDEKPSARGLVPV